MADLTTIDNITTQRFNKVVNVPLIPLQTLTTPWVTQASIDVSNVSAVTVFIHFGRISATPFTGSGVNFRIETIHAPTGDNMWVPFTTFTTALGTGLVSATLASPATAGATTISAAGFASPTNVGNQIYLQDATEANSEFNLIIAISGTTLTLQNPLTFAHAQTTTKVTNGAELYAPLVDTTTYSRLRVTVDGSQQTSAVNFDAEVFITTGA